MLDDRPADVLAVPVDELDYIRREAGLEQCLHQDASRVRNIFGRLEDHCVSTDERGKHFPGGNRQRKVERANQPGDSYRAAITHRPLVAELAWHGVPEQAAAFARGVVSRIDALLNVASR